MSLSHLPGRVGCCAAEAVRQAADGVTADDPDFKDTVPYLTTVSDGLKQECLVSELSSSTVQRGVGGGRLQISSAVDAGAPYLSYLRCVHPHKLFN